MVSSDIISQILAVFKGRSQQYNVGSFISNDNGTSFYLSSKRGATPVQIRLSNHGTYLKTWVDRTHLEDSKERLLDPSHCINISIVFIDEGQDITKDCPSQQDCEGCLIQPCIPQTFEGQNELGHPFSVQQYCYQSRYIRKKYINGIVKAIFEAIITGEYVDPLASLKRAAKPKTLSSKQETTNESKTNNNMKKNVVKINENTLRQIVAESVRKVMNEGGVSLSDYDNPLVRYNRMDSDAPWEQDSTYDTSPNEPYYDVDEERWNELVAMRNRGLLSDDELDAIRDKFGY